MEDDDASRLGAGGGIEGVEFWSVDVDVPAINRGEIEGGLIAEIPADRVYETPHVPVGHAVGWTEADGMRSEVFQNAVIPQKLAGEYAGRETGRGNGFRHMVGHLMTFAQHSVDDRLVACCLDAVAMDEEGGCNLMFLQQIEYPAGINAR